MDDDVKVPERIYDRFNARDIDGVLVTCSNVTCLHEKIVNVDAYGDDLLVTSFGPRMRCERCGQRGADVRPNWNETAPPSLFGAPMSAVAGSIGGKPDFDVKGVYFRF